MFGVWTELKVTQTTKDTKFSVVRDSPKKTLIWRREFKSRIRHTVDEVNGSCKGIGPVGEWQSGMRQ